MEQPIIKKENVERVSSPEQLSDYLHVTTPAIWVVLIAVILLLASLFVWSSVTALESFAEGEAEVAAYIFIQIYLSLFYQLHIPGGCENFRDGCYTEAAVRRDGQVPILVTGTEETVAQHVAVYFFAVFVYDDGQSWDFFPVVSDHVGQGGVQFPGCSFV